MSSAKRRAIKKNIKFDIDTEHLIEIYPKDNLCPALGTPMSWGSGEGLHNSPSLDRIKPELGYVRGNVRWLSQRANQIKTNATTADICAVAEYLRKIDC